MEHLLLPGSPVVFVLAWFGWRIACKAGYSGFWGLTAIIPPIGLVALWILASQKDWPHRTQAQPRGNGGRQAPRRKAESAPTVREPGEITIHRPGGPVTRTD